jgi:ribosomal protein S18 acetylase RimI-like enzyme
MAEPQDPIRLTSSQKAQAGRMLARAFLADPVYSALFPDAAERERALGRLFGAVVGYSLVYGVVHTTPALEGAACWLSPGNAELTAWRMLRTGFGLQRAVARFDAQSRRKFLDALAYMDEIHKREVPEPHWYLWALGVEPRCQGQGIGSRLLQPVLAQADQDGTICYLETETESNVGFYERRGFRVVSDGRVPEHGFRIWTMLREALA